MNEIIFNLPNVSKDIKHQSSTDPTVFYNVNLAMMTCTCPDFLRRRSEFAVGSIRRACKHIREELLSLPDIKNSPIEPVLRSKFSYANFIQDLSIPCIIGYSDKKEWINIFALSEDENFREFGYSILEERWSYDTSPLEEEKILQFISSHFSVGDEFDLKNPVDKKSIANSSIIRDELSTSIKKRLRELYRFFENCLADEHIDPDEVRQLISFIKNDKDIEQISSALLNLLNVILEDGKVNKEEQEGLTQYFRILALALD